LKIACGACRTPTSTSWVSPYRLWIIRIDARLAQSRHSGQAYLSWN
jgi:hypothetical protein